MPAGRRERLAWTAVCVAACLPYLRTVSDYFIQDDFGVVQLLAARPWSTFPRWFTMPWMEDIWGYVPDEIRPFPAVSYQITSLPGAAVPELHHVLNIALHAANGLLVLAIARSAAGLSLAGACAAAIAFVLLPAAAESVAWITGRVDSMPALFYLAAFLAYVRWRRGARASSRLYVWSLVWFFFALFSKQNTITLVVALAAYDLFVARRPVRLSWRWVLPYVPFALMTAGFLALRYLVLGEVLRESQLSSQRFGEFGGIVARHLQRIVLGDIGDVPVPLAALAVAYVAAAVVAFARADRASRREAASVLLYFGPVWIALGLAPTVAAGYESPRHAYLAAAGWTIVVGIAFDLLRKRRSGPQELSSAWAWAGTVMTAGILVAYGILLHRTVADWSLRAAVSERAVTVLERQVVEAQPGSLVLIGVPPLSWEWATPFAVRPPFAGSDLRTRAFVVAPRLLHCCRGTLWENETRTALRRWERLPGASVVALFIDDRGEVRRLTSTDDPDLTVLVRTLRTTESGDDLDGAIVDILRKLVAGRGPILLPALRTR
jgi:hypothetical protein